MDETVLDLRKVYGMKISYTKDQLPVSPDLPFEIIAELYPNGKSALHIHPHQEEYYKVVEGKMEVYLNGEWKQLNTGEEITLPKGTIHGFRNTGTLNAVVFNKHSPGLRFGESLEIMQRLVSEKKITGTTGLKNTIYLCLHTIKYADLLILVKPPQSVVKFMAKLGGFLGYRI